MTYFNKLATLENIKKYRKCKNFCGEKIERIFASELENIEFKENKDFIWQYPLFEEFVVDFAFPKEKFAIELDGIEHHCPRGKKRDKKRDTILLENDWSLIRIDYPDLQIPKKLRFWLLIIREHILDIRKTLEPAISTS